MRCSSKTIAYLVLTAALAASASAQRAGFAETRPAGTAALPSSTAFGMGANVSGRASFPSSTAIGAGAPTRSSLSRSSSGFYGSSRRNTTSRAGQGFHGDYRNVPYGYFLNPYYYPFLDYGSAPYGGAPDDSYYDPSADTAMVTQNLMGEQIQRLTAEIEQMKYAQQQPMAASPAPAGNPQPPEPVVPVTVVLRNGQKLQVQNYAVMDNTFWDFSKQPARKIPLSSIDLSASSQATAASGGEFPDINSGRK